MRMHQLAMPIMQPRSTSTANVPQRVSPGTPHRHSSPYRMTAQTRIMTSRGIILSGGVFPGEPDVIPGVVDVGLLGFGR